MLIKKVSGEPVRDDQVLVDFFRFLEEHEVDTDCLDADIKLFDEENDCNLYDALGRDEEPLVALRQTMRHQRIMSMSFATGHQLFYWKWYRTATKKDVAANYLLAKMDLGGHSPAELSVNEYFKDLKEEIMATGLVGVKTFEDSVVKKAAAYLQSQHCRKITSKPCGSQAVAGPDPLYFDIPWDSPLSAQHLQAIILYCDFTELCTLFSQSVRPMKWNDELKDVMARNAKFFHLSKLLRELVTYFGNNGTKSMNGKVNGPFFSGVSVVLNVSEFSIGFNTPTSTTKSPAIAWRFAGSDGMVLNMGNEKGFATLQPVFDATWISSFVEEDEYFWFGSVNRLSLDDIAIVTTCRIYRHSLAALFLFDGMLTRQKIRARDVTDEHVRILEYCIKRTLNEKELPQKPQCVDQFVMDNVHAFCQRKTTVKLSSLNLNKKVPETFSNLVFCGRSETYQVPADRTNIFQPVLFSLFPNMVELQLFTNLYVINLLMLLSVLEDAVIPESFQVLKLEDYIKRWMKSAFEDIPNIEEQYREKGWSIEFETIAQSDWIFIKRIS